MCLSADRHCDQEGALIKASTGDEAAAPPPAEGGSKAAWAIVSNSPFPMVGCGPEVGCNAALKTAIRGSGTSIAVFGLRARTLDPKGARVLTRGDARVLSTSADEVDSDAIGWDPVLVRPFSAGGRA